MKVAVETLDNGMRAAFVNLPHFRTTSARLLIHSGSLHENPETAGAAHYLEHVTLLQGTEDYPGRDGVRDYTEAYGLKHNAFTSQTGIRYIVDGYYPRTVGSLITQLAFFPSLDPESQENERKPIVDEIRGYASAPNFQANIAHMDAIRGSRYARPIGGTIADVLKIEPENIVSYYKRNYRLANAVLVMCSVDSAKTQRKIIETNLAKAQDIGEPVPVAVELPEFNPYGRRSSLQQVDLPLDAQSTVGINFGLPPVTSLNERYEYNILGSAFARLTIRRLRSELALCYSAQGGTARLDNLHFGANDNWAHLWLSANLDGGDSLQALDAMRNDIIGRPIPESAVDLIRRGLKRALDHVLEGNPSETANFIANILSSEHTDEIDFEEGLALAERISTNKLNKLQKDLAEQVPLVTATSPDPSMLESVGEWASDLT